jgi:3,4-dihydroxy 2-butanone 4-phosphate synthase/GTP cyclohydrolase II
VVRRRNDIIQSGNPKIRADIRYPLLVGPRTYFYNQFYPQARELTSFSLIRQTLIGYFAMGKESVLQEEAPATCSWSTTDLTVERVAVANLPTQFGEFKIAGYRSLISDEEFVVLFKGEMRREVPTLVRIHSQCLTGDVFGSTKCDCGQQLHQTLRLIQKEGRGAVVYQQQEGRGIGIINKIRAYALQDAGADTVEANEQLGLAVDLREYRQCAEVLFELGLCHVRVISNNPLKLQALEDAGLKIVERVSIEVEPTEKAAGYLRTKKEKLGHLLKLDR